MFHFFLFSNALTKMAMGKFQLQTWGIGWATWEAEMVCFCRRPSLQSRQRAVGWFDTVSLGPLRHFLRILTRPKARLLDGVLEAVD